MFEKIIKKIKIVPLILLFTILALFSCSYNTQDIYNATEKQEILDVELSQYSFRTEYLLEEHFKKHGKKMGFKTAEEYEKAANKVIASKDALIKEEKEDGDYVYYIEKTNEIVFLSKDGYIRSYFNPAKGKKYFDKQ